MSDQLTCKRCGASYWSWSLLDNHQKRNLFQVLDMENNSDDWEDSTKVCAFDPDEAVTIACERFDEGEQPTERTLHVRQIEDKDGNAIENPEVKVFETSFDYSVDYHCHERTKK